MIPALDPDPESDFQHFGDSGSNKKKNRNTSKRNQSLLLAKFSY